MTPLDDCTALPRDTLLNALSSCRPQMASFTERLVRVPTENPPGRHYRDCVDVIAAEVSALGLEPQIVEIPAPDDHGERRYALLASLGAGDRTLYFHGHYDVVPASVDGQFAPVVRDGSLFGRGSSDMKSGLASMLYAVHALERCGVQLDGTITLAFVPDEETGGALGSRVLVDQRLIAERGIGMLTPEPTSGVVWNANRGALSVLVTVKGRPAHVGLQFQGINAFERMMTVAGLLAELKAEVEQRRTAYAIHPEAARRSILLLGGRADGGSNFNVVPAECRFTVDRRMNPEEDFVTEKARLFEVFDRARSAGIELEVEVLQEGRPSGIDAQSSVARALGSSVAEIAGRPPRFEMCPGLLETRFYAERGVPAFAYGPGVLAVSHGPNEFVKLDRIVDCAGVYALTAARLLGRRER